MTLRLAALTPIVRQAFAWGERHPIHLLGAQTLYRVAEIAATAVAMFDTFLVALKNGHNTGSPRQL